MKKLLLLFALIATAITASAYNHILVDGIYYQITSEEDLTCEVTWKDGIDHTFYAGDIVIPSEMTVGWSGKTYTVTAIGRRAFQYEYYLKSIVIPNTVETINEDAFWGCHNLTSLEIPSSVKEIGKRAFYCCENLTSLKFSEGLIEIKESAFSGCDRLKSVEIPNSVIKIGSSSFSCDSLESVVLGSSVEIIDEWGIHGKALKEIISLNTTPPNLSETSFGVISPYLEGGIANIVRLTIKVPEELLQTYADAEIWCDFNRYNRLFGLSEDEIKQFTAVNSIQSTRPVGKVFNLQGQPVGEDNKGIVIQGGKKVIRK